MAADVAHCLGYTLDNLKYHMRTNIGADERVVIRLPTVTRGEQQRVIISESGLYRLVMRSDKPEARAFQDWVTRDVLPAIRKDGAYVMGEEFPLAGSIGEVRGANC